MSDEKKRKKKTGPAPTPGWMTSYGDMTTLLLTFFVFMFTTATIDGQEFRLILTAFRGSLGMLTGGQTLQAGRLEEMGMIMETLPAQQKGNKLAKAKQKAIQFFEPEIKSKKVRVAQDDERGIVITLVNDAYFKTGSAEINIKETEGILNKITDLILDIDNDIRIEGHTDDIPIVSSEFDSNWELSTQRAVNVLKYIVSRSIKLGVEEKDVSERMSAAGYGPYRPISGNENRTPEERAQNRRVDIIILWKELS